MNEQPQPNLQPQQRDEQSPLYSNGPATPPSAFNGYDLAVPPPPAAPSVVPIPPENPGDEAALSWESSEYVHHAKGFGWFASFTGVMLLLLGVAYFLTHAWTFIILVVVMAVTIGVFATRPPRMLHYVLTTTGVRIENSTYLFADFRAFGIIHDDTLYSIVLIPTKRFAPAVNLYFAEPDGEKIVDILGTRLPMEELHLDFVDGLMRKLRF